MLTRSTRVAFISFSSISVSFASSSQQLGQRERAADCYGGGQVQRWRRKGDGDGIDGGFFGTASRCIELDRFVRAELGRFGNEAEMGGLWQSSHGEARSSSGKESTSTLGSCRRRETSGLRRLVGSPASGTTTVKVTAGSSGYDGLD